MRFKRLTIRDYRGVGEATVDFAESGITLVHGPNEAGKSSLAEAVITLFKLKSSSTKVKAVKPVDRDAGPSVELEAASGPYHFTYAKRFLKRHGTTLNVHSPSVENLTGDLAHARVEAILRETLRKELWDALFSNKKDADLLQAEGNAALMRCLDSAAGGDGEGEPDGGDTASEGIYERVMDNYCRYFTLKTGRETTEITGAKARHEEAAAEKLRLETILRDLDAKTERSAALRRDKTTAESRLAAARNRLAETERAASELAELEQAMNGAVHGLTAAKAEAARAAWAWRERKTGIDAVAAAEGDLAAAARAMDDGSAAASLEKALLAAEAALAKASSSRDAADLLASLARRDCDYLRDRESLADLQAAAARLENAQRDAAGAESEIAANPVTQQLIRALRKAGAEAARLESLLERDAPAVVLTGLGAAEVAVDGEAIRLGEAEEREYTVSGSMTVTVPGTVRLEVRSGDAVEAERHKLDEAAARLGALLQTAGCASVDEAEELADRRSGAEAALADARRRIENEPPEAALRARIGRMDEALSRYATSRGDLAPLPDNLDNAYQSRTHTESALLSAEKALAAARSAAASARERRDAAVAAGREARLRHELAQKSLEAAGAALGRARETVADEVLKTECDAAEKALAAAAERAETTRAAWLARNPEGAAAAVREAVEAVHELERRLRDTEFELRDLAAELRVRGGDGVYESFESARAEEEEARLALASLQARASAAKLLYETMTDARETARQNYQRPLKAVLEELGRGVFGEGFRVGLNDALAIESRTVGNVTVPYESLSGGAQEQLALLFRAACAILVSEQEGMPLLLDDVLGHSDPERLALMAAALEAAAERCQVVIFTCMPDRYAGLRGAKLVGIG